MRTATSEEVRGAREGPAAAAAAAADGAEEAEEAEEEEAEVEVVVETVLLQGAAAAC